MPVNSRYFSPIVLKYSTSLPATVVAARRAGIAARPLGVAVWAPPRPPAPPGGNPPSPPPIIMNPPPNPRPPPNPPRSANIPTLRASATLRSAKSRRLSVVGGLTVSTLLTLFVVPVVYAILDDISGWVVRRWRGAAPEGHA